MQHLCGKMQGVFDLSLKENITRAECNELKRLVPQLVIKYKEDL